MKKLVFVSLALLVGAGIVIGYRMAKGQGWSCCGWGGQKVDPWSTYTPPTDESAAGAGAEAETAEPEAEAAEGEAAETEAAVGEAAADEPAGESA